MEKKKLTLGVFGFGCVGQGLYDVLEQTRGVEAEIKTICVKDPSKKRTVDASRITFKKEDILNDPSIDVVVELIDDADAAWEIVSEALRKRKAVVTANKKMVAEHFEELFQLQKDFDVPLLYEASSCASIPVIRNLEEYYDNDLLNGVEGIFNGSSNFILSKMEKEGRPYEEALKEAQDLGFAETDPTLDVGGFDPKYKLAIIISHAFGVFIKPENIINYGIQHISDNDLKYAKEKGWKIKLVASARKVGDKLCAFVLPRFVRPDEKLFLVDDEYNGVVVEGAFSDEQFFGKSKKDTGSHRKHYCAGQLLFHIQISRLCTVRR